MSKARVAVATLTVTAAAVLGIFSHEGYSERAYVPVPGDKVTIGHGSTAHIDGTPIKMGETVTKPQALEMARRDISKFEGALKSCVKVPLHQYEYNAYISLEYNIGSKAFCGSTIVKRLNAGDYVGACKAILMWNIYKGKPLAGLTKRRQGEYKQCVGAA
jgi:lysozyme